LLIETIIINTTSKPSHFVAELLFALMEDHSSLNETTFTARYKANSKEQISIIIDKRHKNNKLFKEKYVQ
jgi:hypothetical protein